MFSGLFWFCLFVFVVAVVVVAFSHVFLLHPVTVNLFDCYFSSGVLFGAECINTHKKILKATAIANCINVSKINMS